MTRANTYPTICFSAFVLWLTVIVMDGPLLLAAGIPDASNFFLPAHILFLLVIGLFCPPAIFRTLAPVNCVLTVILTLSIPLAGWPVNHYLLVAAGACGAFVAINACTALRQSPAPLLSAACGLVIANILFIPFGIWADDGVVLFAAATLPLLSIPVLVRHLPEPEPAPDTPRLWHYLFFIFIFQIISGLMYAFIMPAYQDSAILPGFELLFYMGGIGAAYLLAREKRDLAMVLAVILGMVAFTLLQGGNPAWINLGMFAMMGGAGIIDLVFISVLLSAAAPIRGFGVGLAVFCAGILGGKIIGVYYSDMTGAIIMTGHLVLNLSVIALYFHGRQYYTAALSEPEALLPKSECVPIPPIDTDLVMPDNQNTAADPIPEHWRMLLSEREYEVFKMVAAGRTYRETGHELEISESTVKTYMSRIYEKVGVKGKKQLFDKLKKS